MHRIQIPLQDFALKMQGEGLCVREGVFAGHYGVCIWHCILAWIVVCFLTHDHNSYKSSSFVGDKCAYRIKLCLTTKNSVPSFLNLPCILLFCLRIIVSTDTF